MREKKKVKNGEAARHLSIVYPHGIGISVFFPHSQIPFLSFPFAWESYPSLSLSLIWFENALPSLLYSLLHVYMHYFYLILHASSSLEQ